MKLSSHNTFICLLTLFTTITACNDSSKQAEEPVAELSITQSMSPQKTLEALSLRAVEALEHIVIDSLKIPRSVEANRELKLTKSKSWTSGFYPGMLWQLYSVSRNEKLKEAAEQWTKFVEKEKHDAGTHDLGFKIYCPYGNAYKITNEKKYRDVYITAAQTLSTRYNDKIGAIRSWDFNAEIWQHPVIIDNMMNLEMLFEVALATNDSKLYELADQHAMTTLNNHFRPDNSSYHVVDYNPVTGEVNTKNTHQGLSHDSAWSRGQAWGLYGYTTAYRYTRKKEYLEQAQKIANYIFMHPNLPEDMIPYWDYDVTNSDEPRDVSAATVAASGLLELSIHDSANSIKYVEWADKVLSSLASDKYQTNRHPFFLKHSVGSIPGEFEIDVPIIYADYYYVEALIRRTKL